MSFIPSYNVRYSTKAKYLQLRITSTQLEVIVPSAKNITVNQIHCFILQKKRWIKKKLSQFFRETNQENSEGLPTKIHLQAINEVWDVHYIITNHKKLKIISNRTLQLTLLGPVTEEKQCVKLLQNWLKKMAAAHLRQQLILLSNKIFLPFKKFSIRHNKGRWGSCNTEGNINLCCKLLFLPPNLVEHVLLHELCHTKIMNHSKLFWQLLARVDRSCTQHKIQLKTAESAVPRWAKL